MEKYAVQHQHPIEDQAWFSASEPTMEKVVDELFTDPKKEALRRGTPIIKRNESFGFMHLSFYSYLLTLKAEPLKKEIFLRLNKKDYNFKKLLERAKFYRV